MKEDFTKAIFNTPKITFYAFVELKNKEIGKTPSFTTREILLDFLEDTKNSYNKILKIVEDKEI